MFCLTIQQEIDVVLRYSNAELVGDACVHRNRTTIVREIISLIEERKKKKKRRIAPDNNHWSDLSLRIRLRRN